MFSECLVGVINGGDEFFVIGMFVWRYLFVVVNIGRVFLFVLWRVLFLVFRLMWVCYFLRVLSFGNCGVFGVISEVVDGDVC